MEQRFTDPNAMTQAGLNLIQQALSIYNKDLELQYRGRLRELKSFVPVKDGESDLLKAMKQVAETNKGPKNQIPSAGCSIKWKYD